MSEKVIGKSGRLVTRDHPHEILSPRVMRFAEIRHWLAELSTNPAYGWTNGGIAALSRALGMKDPRHIGYKLKYSWIWPKEQVRLTARITDILDGRIVPRRMGRRIEGMYVDPPEPRCVPAPLRRIVLTATPAGMTLKAPHLRPRPHLPAFKDAFADALRWDGTRR
jgi:hypothetical protein